MTKILFMGTPDFAKESLQGLYESGENLIGVVTNPDKPQGRGMKLTVSPVKQYALEKNLPVYQPEKVRNNTEFLETVKKLAPDLICVVAYGKILPPELLQIPPLGCVNVHGSLLPKYRGAAPIQWAVLNGDKVTGITTMYMDEGMDTGDMILKQEVAIGENETTGELWKKLSKVGANLLCETVKLIKQGKAPREKQEENFSMAPMLQKEMANIDWENKTAQQIHNLIRGLNPIMGAYSFLEGKKIKFWKAKAHTKESFLKQFPEMQEYAYKLKEITEGTVLYADDKQGLWINAKDGILEVIEMQAENAKRMVATDFLRGNAILAGSVFESHF